MRKNIVAGNWKMNTTVPEGVELAKAVVEKSAQVPEGVGLIIATPFTHLVPVSEVVKGTRVELSAENCAEGEGCLYRRGFSCYACFSRLRIYNPRTL